jgi:hypothetical protein
VDYYDSSKIAIEAARKREIVPVQTFVEQAIDIWESREALLSRLSPLSGGFLAFRGDIISALDEGLITGHGPDEVAGALELLEGIITPTSEIYSLEELDPSGEFGTVRDYLRSLARGEIFAEDLDTVWEFIVDVLETTQGIVSLGDSPVEMSEPVGVN